MGQKRMFYHKREWELKATPDELWPYLSNTHLTNYHGGNPALKSTLPKGERLANGYHRLYAVITEFEEEPFEWVQPFRFRSVRRFLRVKLFDELWSSVELVPQDNGYTRAVYEMGASAGHWYTTPLVPLIIRIVLHGFQKPLRKIEKLLIAKRTNPVTAVPTIISKRARFTRTGRTQLKALTNQLIADVSPLATRLQTYIEQADVLDLARIRPYVLADYWQVERTAVLDLFLHATQQGLLDMYWEILCPLCRGAKERNQALQQLMTEEVHCDSCNISFDANFARSVELVFRPNSAICHVEEQEFCVGGPNLTPHIVLQQLLRPHEQRTITLPLEEGSYRLRRLEARGHQPIEVTQTGQATHTIQLNETSWSSKFLSFAPKTTLQVHNQTAVEQLLILERTRWSDQAVLGAEVIARQTFRDLFSNEALRPGEQITVGRTAILFTALPEASELYRSLGDAVAFARVLDHFAVLRQSIQDHEGAVVKTIEDSVMAAFVQPEKALQALWQAQELLANEFGIHIQAGIHYGACIAVTLNGRLDYFGTTVNLAARLKGMAHQDEIVISDEAYQYPQVQQILQNQGIKGDAFQTAVKGFDNQTFVCWRLPPVQLSNST